MQERYLGWEKVGKGGNAFMYRERGVFACTHADISMYIHMYARIFLSERECGNNRYSYQNEHTRTLLASVHTYVRNTYIQILLHGFVSPMYMYIQFIYLHCICGCV